METFCKSVEGDYYISQDGLRGIIFTDSLGLNTGKTNSLLSTMSEILKNKCNEVPNGYGMFLKNKQNELLFLKYKYDGQNLSLYNYYLSPENRESLKITKINNLPIEVSINRIKHYFGQNITFEDIEIILNCPKLLKEIGVIKDDYNIALCKNDKVFEISLFNVPAQLNSSFFFKKHEKNELIQKFNKIESIAKENKSPSIKFNYAYDSFCNLVKILCELSTDSDDKKLFYNLYNIMAELSDIKINDDSNLDWMIISSYFLLNEKNKKKLPKSYSDYIEEFPYYFQNCKFLDKENSKTGIFSTEFYEYEIDINGIIKELEVTNLSGVKNDSELNYYKMLKEQGVLTLKHYNLPGCNEYLLSNGKLDYSKLFDSIRNSFAHSSYDVIDENNVRIYGFDPKTNELNYNVMVNKRLVKKLINDYEYYSSMSNVFPIIGMDLESKYFADIEGIRNKEELKEYLNSKKIVNLNNLIIKDDIDFSSYQYYFDTLTRYVGNNGYTLFTSTSEILDLFNSLKKYVDFELGEKKFSEEEIEDIVIEVEKIGPQFYKYGFSNKNLIISNIYRTRKLGINNLNNAFLNIINTKGKINSTLIDTLDTTPTEIYDLSNYLKITIISCLNNILLYSYNENLNIDTSEIDLSFRMDIDKKIISEKKFNRINQLNSEIQNKKGEKLELEQQLLLKKTQLDDNRFLLKAPKSVIKQEKEKLNQLQQKLKNWDEENNKKIDELEQELEELKKLVLEIDNNSFNMNDYILEHLRNSLAHGNINFPNGLDINNISDTEIYFEDYHPKNGTLTFAGSIKLKELIESISNDKYLKSIYLNNNNFKKKC